MPLIEKISQMQKLGISNEEIIKRLQDEGVSPKEISEAIDQSKVKSAIEAGEEMQPSMMPPSQTPDSIPMPYNSQDLIQQYTSTEMPMQEQMPMSMQMPIPEQMTTEQTPEEYAYPTYPQQYQEYEYARTDTGTMTEIAEQIVAEKLQKIEKQISEVTAFKTETSGKISNVDERLRRIEILIDRLQTSILGKIGEYGRNISDLKEEMLATQESFSKILSPLSENIEELRKITHGNLPKKPEKAESKTNSPKTKKDSFERYLRG